MSKPYKISLHGKDGKIHTYSQTFVPFKWVLQIIDFNNRMISENGMKLTDAIDEEAQMIEDIFDSKAVTKQALLDGLNASDGREVMENLLMDIAHLVPNPETVEQLVSQMQNEMSDDSSSN